jgi:magnesium-transporting ATPase (P-type)
LIGKDLELIGGRAIGDELQEGVGNCIGERQKGVDKAAALIGKDLELIGGTAIGDELQEGVGDCM